MLSFATEFPVAPERTTADFLQAMVLWITGSPHTKLSAGTLQELAQKEEASVQRDNEHVNHSSAILPTSIWPVSVTAGVTVIWIG